VTAPLAAPRLQRQRCTSRDEQRRRQAVADAPQTTQKAVRHASRTAETSRDITVIVTNTRRQRQRCTTRRTRCATSPPRPATRSAGRHARRSQPLFAMTAPHTHAHTHTRTRAHTHTHTHVRYMTYTDAIETTTHTSGGSDRTWYPTRRHADDRSPSPSTRSRRSSTSAFNASLICRRPSISRRMAP
jgi:hypothetical protein